MKKLILLAFTLIFLSSSAYANEKSNLTILSDKYVEIMQSIRTAHQRLIVDLDRNELDYSKLDSIYSSLSEAQTQIDSIQNQLYISEFITDKKSKLHANKFIQMQKVNIAKQDLLRADACEKYLTNIKSQEASLLILRARDIFKESAQTLSDK